MKSFNETSVAGMVCRDVELKFTGSGTAVASWSMATNRKRGENETTTWWKIVAFGKTAELAGEYLKKGSNVHVTGETELEEWTDRDGNKRQTLTLNVNSLRFLDSKGDNGESTSHAEAPLRKPEPTPTDGDIPF